MSSYEKALAMEWNELWKKKKSNPNPKDGKEWNKLWQRNEINLAKWNSYDIALGKKWNKIKLAKNEIISYEKAQEKEWNSLTKEWNVFHSTILGISYHNFHWGERDRCAGKCLGFIIRDGRYKCASRSKWPPLGTTPPPRMTWDNEHPDDTTQQTQGQMQGQMTWWTPRWHDTTNAGTHNKHQQWPTPPTDQYARHNEGPDDMTKAQTTRQKPEWHKTTVQAS